jgi:hypothetical protein
LDTSKVDRKCFERFEIWRWRGIKISWADRVLIAEVLERVKWQRNILFTVKRTATWNSHILLRNCLLMHVFAGKLEETGRRESYWMTFSKREDTGN